MSLGHVLLRFSGDRIKVLDAQGAQNGEGSPATLRHGLLVLTVAQIDVHHPHGFQRLPSLFRGKVNPHGWKSEGRVEHDGIVWLNCRYSELGCVATFGVAGWRRERIGE